MKTFEIDFLEKYDDQSILEELRRIMCIATEIAAEQRTVIAHSVSYGLGRPHFSKAPAGAKENPGPLLWRIPSSIC